MSNDITIVDKNRGFLDFSNLDSALKCSQIIAGSGVCPAGYKGKPDDVLIAVQMGQELGLKPMQALQNIAVINGRPSIWGDAMLALCKSKDDFEYCNETFDNDKGIATCEVKRKGEEKAQTRTFSKEDAQQAGLANKAGVWKSYPKRMLQMRARGFALRDVFPHHLRGIITKEESMDYPVEKPKAKDAEVIITQLDHLKNLIKIKGTPKETIQMWLDAAGVEKLEELTDDQVDKTVALLEKKPNKSQADILADQFEEDDDIEDGIILEGVN